MRLTLRTLLAWRDGLLSGKEQEELAARVTDGSVAQGLLDRMEAVETRHDIEPPKVEGRGLGADANSVAEYLENVLDMENLEAFERICLESDRQLSEVSACHAMLAEATHRRVRGGTPTGPLLKAVASRLASGQPSELPAERARQVQGTPRQPDAPRRQPSGGVADVPPQIRIASEPSEQGATTSPRRTRQGSPWLQVAVAVGLLCLVGGGLAVTLWWNPAARDARDKFAATDPQQPAIEVEQPAAEDVAADSGTAEAPPAGDGSGPDPEFPDAELVAVSPALPPVRAGESDAGGEGGGADDLKPNGPDGAESSLSADAVAVVPPAMDSPLGVGPSVPMGDALAIAAPLAPGPETLVPPMPAPEPPLPPVGPASLPLPAPQATPVGVVADGPLVLVADRDQPGQWRGCFKGDRLSPGVQLLAPSASTPELNLGGVVVTLAPCSQVVLRPDDGAGGTPRVDLEVVFGAATVRRLSGESEVDVRAGGLQWRLSGPPSAVMLRVALGRQPGADPGEGGFVTSKLVALDTEVTWAPLAGSAMLEAMPAGGSLDGGQAATWESAEAHEVRLDAAGADLESVAITPADRLAVSAAEELATAAAEGGDAIAAARGLLLSRRVEVREAAAVLLALVGDYQPAVTLLCDDGAGSRLGERRWRAFEKQVIPLALARGVHSAERLSKAFADQLQRDEGGRVYRLAVGLSDADLAAGADAELVADLEDPQLVVRRYAALRLEEIVEPPARDRLRYRADAAADARLEGVRWWASQREKGLILRANGEQLSGPDPG